MRLLATLTACAVLLPGLSRAAEPFRVCVLEYNSPLSEKASGKGFDLDVARAVAERMGRPFEPVWIENEEKMTEADESDLPLKPLAKGACDAVASVPGREALGSLRDKLALSRPYYGEGFELVAPDPSELESRKLGEMHDKRVSVQSVTVGHLVAEAIGLQWTAQTSPAEQIAALDSHRADVALVWGPALADFGRKPVEGYTPPEVLRWNVSFATRASDRGLGQQVDEALAGLVREGRIAALMKAHGMPEHAPFATAFTPMAFRALQFEGAMAAAAHPIPAAWGTSGGMNGPQQDEAGAEKSEPPAAKPAEQPKAEPAEPTAKPSEAPAQPRSDAGGEGGASPVAKYLKDPAAVKRGEMIYTGTCGAYCHPSSNNDATDAPFLFDCDWKHGGSDQQIYHTIKTGVPGTRMVSFAKALPDEDIWKIIAYLRSVSQCKK